MSRGVDSHELQALREALHDGAERVPPAVELRNFRQPRRLSNARLAHLSKLIGSVLPRACTEIAAPLRAYHKVTLASVSEVNAQSLFSGLGAPFVVLCFDCQGHTSWLVWESTAAAAAVERVLSGPLRGSADQEDERNDTGREGEVVASIEARRLSRSEKRVIAGVLFRLIRPVAEALGLPIVEGEIAQEPEELRTLEDSGPDADARRLLLHFSFDGPGGASDLRLYLPGVGEDDDSRRAARERVKLPDHLDAVQMSLAAYLGSVDVPLQELLALEVGDVIPLGVEVDSPVELYVEDRACALAAWGRWHGNLAVKVLTLDPHPGDIDQPADES